MQIIKPFAQTIPSSSEFLLDSVVMCGDETMVEVLGLVWILFCFVVEVLESF